MMRKQQSTLTTRNMQEVTFVNYLISYIKRDFFYSYMLEDEDMRSSEDTEMKPLEKLL